MLQPSPRLLLLFRNLWPCLIVCWLQVLSLLAQHWFCVWAVDVHFPFLPPLLDKVMGVFCQSGSGSGRCCCAWGRGLVVWGEGCCHRPAPGGSSSPLDGLLAESPSHTRRHLLRSGLSEAELLLPWQWGEMWLSAVTTEQHYDLLRIDGLNLTVRDSGVVAHTWASHPAASTPCFLLMFSDAFLPLAFAHFLPVSSCT